MTPQNVASFWNEALRWGGITEAADGTTAICHPLDAGVYLEFVRVPEDKVIKNRLHLGCTAGALHHLGHEMERLLGLGATIAWEEEFPAHVATRYRNVVLRDTEGNEFCLGAGTCP